MTAVCGGPGFARAENFSAVNYIRLATAAQFTTFHHAFT
jgi:hypothetical protein